MKAISYITYWRSFEAMIFQLFIFCRCSYEQIGFVTKCYEHLKVKHSFYTLVGVCETEVH